MTLISASISVAVVVAARLARVAPAETAAMVLLRMAVPGAWLVPALPAVVRAAPVVRQMVKAKTARATVVAVAAREMVILK